MSRELIDSVESAFRRGKPLAFRVGDTVTVYQRIVEGDKERIQPFTGVVVARRGRGTQETFTVRRIVNNEGVERIFPVNSPKITGIEVVRSGRIRRAKLYYLRKRVGKARRLRDRRMSVGAAASSAADRTDETDRTTDEEAVQETESA